MNIDRRRFIKTLGTGLAGTALSGCALSSPREAFRARSKMPNIILILTDDQGYGDSSASLHDQANYTPNLERLARRGITFTDGYAAAAMCTPSRATLLSGRYHGRLGMYDVTGDAGIGFPPGEKIMPQNISKNLAMPRPVSVNGMLEATCRAMSTTGHSIKALIGFGDFMAQPTITGNLNPVADSIPPDTKAADINPFTIRKRLLRRSSISLMKLPITHLHSLNKTRTNPSSSMYLITAVTCPCTYPKKSISNTQISTMVRMPRLLERCTRRWTKESGKYWIGWNNSGLTIIP